LCSGLLHDIVTHIVSLVLIYFLRRFHSASFVQRGSVLHRDNSNEVIYGRVSNYTVEVMGLPTDLTDNAKLRAAFEDLYPNQIYRFDLIAH
jgi:hypothetical protein